MAYSMQTINLNGKANLWLNAESLTPFVNGFIQPLKAFFSLFPTV